MEKELRFNISINGLDNSHSRENVFEFPQYSNVKRELSRCYTNFRNSKVLNKFNIMILERELEKTLERALISNFSEMMGKKCIYEQIKKNWGKFKYLAFLDIGYRKFNNNLKKKKKI